MQWPLVFRSRLDAALLKVTRWRELAVARKTTIRTLQKQRRELLQKVSDLTETLKERDELYAKPAAPDPAPQFSPKPTRIQSVKQEALEARRIK